MRLRRAEGVGVVDAGAVVYAATLPDGPILVLAGVSALVWRVAAETGGDGLLDRVAAATHEDAGRIAPHVERFVDDLVDRGLLVRDGE